MHPSMQTRTHAFLYSFTHLHILSFIRCLARLFIYSFAYPHAHLVIPSSSDSFIHSFAHSSENTFKFSARSNQAYFSSRCIWSFNTAEVKAPPCFTQCNRSGWKLSNPWHWN